MFAGVCVCRFRNKSGNFCDCTAPGLYCLPCTLFPFSFYLCPPKICSIFCNAACVRTANWDIAGRHTAPNQRNVFLCISSAIRSTPMLILRGLLHFSHSTSAVKFTLFQYLLISNILIKIVCKLELHRRCDWPTADCMFVGTDSSVASCSSCHIPNACYDQPHATHY